jgi:starch-binding outer membrane protein, SusD/RagB family
MILMMKKNKLIGSILTLILVSSLYTCNVIDVAPNDRIDLDKFYTSSSDAESGLIGAYINVFNGPAVNYIFYNNRSSDDLTAPLDGRPSDPLMHRPNLNENSGDAAGLWNESYRALATLNLLIERVSKLNEAGFARPRAGEENRKFQIIGEAKFLRAYTYYHLTQFFGDVPLITKFPTTSDPEKLKAARTPKAQVMDTVMSDLAYAEQYLPWQHDNLATIAEDQVIQSKGRATKAAAKLQLARIYLKNREWQKAIDKCREIVASGEFSLVSQWTTIFASSNLTAQNSSESILEIQTKRGAGEFNNTGGYSWFHQDGAPRRGATLEAFNLFEGDNTTRRDVRKEFTMSQVSTSPNQIYALKYANSFPWWDPANPFNFIPMRLTECYLIMAEALNEISYPNSEALTYINMIRDRARDSNFINGATTGISPYTFSVFDTQAKFRQGIREERRRELMFEGQRWFDLLRYDEMDGTTEAQEAVGLTSPEKTLFPIPQDEIVRNSPLLIQNPGYN